MSIIRKFRNKWRKTQNNLYIFTLRTLNKNKDFSIISNNCWGGAIYEDLGLAYRTPTIGLFFHADDYLKFVVNLEYYISIELKFTEQTKHELFVQFCKENKFPIGVLDDIEIFFQHYHSEEEAREKWERRKERINFRNMYLKMDDRDGATIEHLEKFEKIENIKNKVIFISKKHKNLSSSVYLPEYKNAEMVGDLYTNRNDYRKHFNVLKWLNK